MDIPAEPALQLPLVSIGPGFGGFQQPDSIHKINEASRVDDPDSATINSSRNESRNFAARSNGA